MQFAHSQSLNDFANMDMNLSNCAGLYKFYGVGDLYSANDIVVFFSGENGYPDLRNNLNSLKFDNDSELLELIDDKLMINGCFRMIDTTNFWIHESFGNSHVGHSTERYFEKDG